MRVSRDSFVAVPGTVDIKTAQYSSIDNNLWCSALCDFLNLADTIVVLYLLDRARAKNRIGARVCWQRIRSRF
jgi:hypothetical protein